MSRFKIVVTERTEDWLEGAEHGTCDACDTCDAVCSGVCICICICCAGRAEGDASEQDPRSSKPSLSPLSD